jgi:hypothetical protein
VTSSIFQRLTKGDLNASTAILQPNEPGSTNLRLSWLWHNAHIQTGVVADAAADANANANANTDAESNVEDISSAESPTTSQIERCTPSCVTLLIYSHADFSYIDDTWLPGSDDMMSTSENE